MSTSPLNKITTNSAGVTVNEPNAVNRFFHMDLLRAVAILGVMVTHSLALFLGPAAINSAWNYLHFIVVGFVFCSGYISVSSYKRITNGKNLFPWYKKRFIRLYLPYLTYLLFYTLLLSFPTIISGRGIVLSRRFLFDSVTLAGGADIGWLTLLFLQLAILTPVLMKINRNNRLCTAVLTTTGLFACITTFLRIPAEYSRATAWFPWLFIFMLGSHIAQKDKQRNMRARYYILAGLISIFIWLLSGKILTSLHEPLTLTVHKYPPDMFYFLYGIGFNSLLLGFTKFRGTPGQWIQSSITWISKHSYGMFFLHLLLLDATSKMISRGNMFVIMAISIGATFLFTWGWTSFVQRVGEFRINKN